MIITNKNEIPRAKPLLMTSIGGSPIHPGHTRLLRDCKQKVLDYYKDSNEEDSPQRYEELNLLVVVNCDDFLIRKHGFVFQNENDRAEIINSIKDVDYVYIHQSDKQTIDDAIYKFDPDFFLKGGDRSSISNLPECEVKACVESGCEIIFGVGGADKVSSSSDLLKRTANHYLFEKNVDEWVDFERFTRGTCLKCHG